MGYVVGVDLGTTFTAAAVVRNGAVSMVTLGHRSTAVPTAVFAAEGGSLLVGEEAVSAGLAEPERLATEFKRRLGDVTPLLLDGRPWSPQALLARVLRTVLEQITTEEGGPPDLVVLTHPANWGPFKRELLDDVVRLADLGVAVSTITEPEAAAGWYAEQQRLAEGATIAVYDLGGGTFDAAILARRDGHFAILGRPLGIEHLGGIDIDHALLGATLDRLGVTGSFVPTTADARQRLARQRVACTEVKEALSARRSASLTNWLTGEPPSLVVERDGFEALISALVDQTVTVLGQAVAESGVAPDRLDAVLLVGGTSRIPAVAERLSDQLGRPVTVDAHPKNAVALGAALEAAARLAAQPRPAAVATGARAAGGPARPVGGVAGGREGGGPGGVGTGGGGPDGAGPDEGTGGAGTGGDGTGGAVLRAGLASQRRAARQRRLRQRALAGGATVLALIGAYFYLRPTSADATVSATDASVGTLEAKVPESWGVTETGPWDEPLSGQSRVLGPLALLVNPGQTKVVDLLADERPFLFTTVFDDTVFAEKSMEAWLATTAEPWNAGNALCPSIESVQTRPALVERRYDQCAGGGGFLQRIENIDGRYVYALVRYSEAVSERRAREVLDSIRLLPPG